MAKREWPLSFQCGHEGCTERVTYRFETRRDLEKSPEAKWYSGGKWRCYRHARPDEVLSSTNPSTSFEIVSEEKEYGRYFGSFGIMSGPGFKAFASDFPPGTKLIVTARIEIPEPLHVT